jgi:hypothetical protein
MLPTDTPFHPAGTASQAKALPARRIMSITDAIYARRSVRDFTAENVSQTAIHALLYAAVQAPTSMEAEPWAFVVIQDRALLKALSDGSGLVSRADEDLVQIEGPRPGAPETRPEGLNIFYNAGSLIIIYARPGAFATADCWLAAQNIMLAAVGMGLGSCVIGLAVEALNSAEWRRRLDVPEDLTALAPIVIGRAARHGEAVLRKPPDILNWKL